MKCSYGFFLCASLLGVGLCGVVYRSLHGGTTASTDSAHIPATRFGDQTTLPAPELLQLRQEMARLREQVWAQGQKLPAVDSADRAAQVPVHDARTGPEVRAEELQRHREYVVTIGDSFRKELADPQWSSATSSMVQSTLLGDSDLRSRVRGVECRSRSCRVELTDDRSGKLQRVLPMLALELSRELPGIVATQTEDASGATMMVLYMSRRSDTPATAP